MDCDICGSYENVEKCDVGEVNYAYAFTTTDWLCENCRLEYCQPPNLKEVSFFDDF